MKKEVSGSIRHRKCNLLKVQPFRGSLLKSISLEKLPVAQRASVYRASTIFPPGLLIFLIVRNGAVSSRLGICHFSLFELRGELLRILRKRGDS